MKLLNEVCVNYASTPVSGMMAFNYWSFHKGRDLGIRTVYCFNERDFLKLLAHWNGPPKWVYVPVELPRYHIVRPQVKADGFHPDPFSSCCQAPVVFYDHSISRFRQFLGWGRGGSGEKRCERCNRVLEGEIMVGQRIV